MSPKNIFIIISVAVLFLLVVAFSGGGGGPILTGGSSDTDVPEYDFGELKVVDVKEGEGEEHVKPGDGLRIHYVGYYINKNGENVLFDSSKSRNKPEYLTVGEAKSHISFWQNGLLGMKEGGVRTIEVPADSAYGERSQGPIPPNSTLVIEAELLMIEK